MARKKTWVEKLNDSKDLPKIISLEGKQAEKWGEGTMVIPAPIEVFEIMKMPVKGELLTINVIRNMLALKHQTTTACPLTTGIFAWISANASEEMKEKGETENLIPWWRTLKGKGELNPKFPGGIEKQIQLLNDEGIEIIRKGKKFYVNNFERYLLKELQF